MTINVDITPRPYEPIEKTLRRFTKKCKKEEVVKQFCERLHFKTKRQKAKEKQLKQRRLRQKRGRR